MTSARRRGHVGQLLALRPPKRTRLPLMRLARLRLRFALRRDQVREITAPAFGKERFFFNGPLCRLDSGGRNPEN